MHLASLDPLSLLGFSITTVLLNLCNAGFIPLLMGIFCGSSAIYCSLAQVINEVYGKTALLV